jgi:hypothetical protein
VIDNLTSAAHPISSRDDDVQMWHRMKEFMFWIRNSGRTILLIHHAGKSGLQRGTSMREDDQDIILRLTTPAEVLDQRKLAIQIELEKTRDLEAGQKEGVYAEFWLENGRPVWNWQPLKEARAELIRRTAQTIKNKNCIAGILGCSVYEVYKVLAERQEPSGEPDYSDAVQTISEEYWNSEDDNELF